MHALLALVVVAGTWIGESKCVGNKHPACKDEIVRYHVPAPDAAGRTHVLADKKVDGAWIEMGDLDFTLDGTDTLVGELKRKGFSGRWTLTVKGDAMTGTLTELPGGEVARRVSARRAP